MNNAHNRLWPPAVITDGETMRRPRRVGCAIIIDPMDIVRLTGIRLDNSLVSASINPRGHIEIGVERWTFDEPDDIESESFECYPLKWRRFRVTGIVDRDGISE